MDKSKALICIRGFYFLYFGAVGCLSPYLNLYYQRVGLTGLQIGVLSAIAALVTQLASPLWGMLGDSHTPHRTLLSVAVGGAAQGLFSGTTMGLAGIVGALIGGWLYDRAGVASLFRLCSLAATFALALFLVSPRAKPALASNE